MEVVQSEVTFNLGEPQRVIVCGGPGEPNPIPEVKINHAIVYWGSQQFVVTGWYTIVDPPTLVGSLVYATLAFVGDPQNPELFNTLCTAQIEGQIDIESSELFTMSVKFAP